MRPIFLSPRSGPLYHLQGVSREDIILITILAYLVYYSNILYTNIYQYISIYYIYWIYINIIQ